MRRTSLLFALLALVLAGCKVDTRVDVAMRADGSGVVRVEVKLDAEAVGRAEVSGGKLEDRIRTSDLAAAGWTVSPWTRAKDGSASITAVKPFVRPGQVAGIVAEISGPDGPLRDFVAVRSAGTLATKYSVTGTVDLTNVQSGVKTDQDLVAKLTAQQVSVDAIDAKLTAQLRDALGVTVRVSVPGATDTTTVKVGQQAAVVAKSNHRSFGRLVLLVVGIALGALALVVLMLGELRGHGPRRRRTPSVR
jgi:hypothetical protein